MFQNSLIQNVIPILFLSYFLNTFGAETKLSADIFPIEKLPIELTCKLVTWKIQKDIYKKCELITDDNIATYLNRMFVKIKDENKNKFYNWIIYVMQDSYSCQKRFSEKISFSGRLDNIWQYVYRQEFDFAFKEIENTKQFIEKVLIPRQKNYQSLTATLENISDVTNQYMHQSQKSIVNQIKDECKQILCSSKSKQEIEDSFSEKLSCENKCLLGESCITKKMYYKKNEFANTFCAFQKKIDDSMNTIAMESDDQKKLSQQSFEKIEKLKKSIKEIDILFDSYQTIEILYLAKLLFCIKNTQKHDTSTCLICYKKTLNNELFTKKFSGKLISKTRLDGWLKIKAEIKEGGDSKNGLELALEYLNEKQKGWGEDGDTLFYDTRAIFKIAFKKTNPYVLTTYILTRVLLSYYLIEEKEIFLLAVGKPVFEYLLILSLYYGFFKQDVIKSFEFESPLSYDACPLVYELVKY